MKRPRSIVRDDSAQAMTEFVVVIPAILLMFLAIFQLITIWHAYLLTTYAAFAATRAGATYDAAPGGTPNAQRMAKNAAALALMPVSRPVEGELEFYGTRVGASGTSGIRSFLQSQAGFKKPLLDRLPAIYNRVTGEPLSDANKLEWLFTAWNRLAYNPSDELRQSYGKQTLFAHRVPKGDQIAAKIPIDKIEEKVAESFASASDLTEINIELKYDYPLFIPGFTALWDFMLGSEAGEAFTQKSPSILYYFYTMKSRCAVGYETFFRDFENAPEEGAEGAELLESLDAERIAEVQQEIVAATALLTSLEQQKAACTTTLCEAQLTVQINAVQQELKDLSEEMEALEVTR